MISVDATEEFSYKEALNYKRDSFQDYTGERLAAIGRLLRQADAIHARSWLWPSTADKAGVSPPPSTFCVARDDHEKRCAVHQQLRASEAALVAALQSVTERPTDHRR